MYEQIEDLTGLCKTSARFWVCVKGHGSATLPVERGTSNEATPATVYRKGNQRFFELWDRFYKVPDDELHHMDGDDTAMGAKMQVNGATIIKDWYHETYPTDPCWEDMHDENNFLDLYNCLNNGNEVYYCLFNGTGMDSLVRERCFQQLAELMHCEYGVVYDQWLHGAEIRKERIAEAVRNCMAILNRDGCGHVYCKCEKVWTNCEKLGYCTLDCGGPYGEEE